MSDRFDELRDVLGTSHTLDTVTIRLDVARALLAERDTLAEQIEAKDAEIARLTAELSERRKWGQHADKARIRAMRRVVRKALDRMEEARAALRDLI